MPSSVGENDCTIKVPQDRVVRDAGRLRWGIVSTIRAPLRDIARFAAFHLDLGASEISIFLDQPNPETVDFFAPFSALKLVQCDADYWEGKREKARSTHQLRQAFNATRCYKRSNLDWLCHIDVDEFLLTQSPIAENLADAPDDAAYMQMLPAELLAQPDPLTGSSFFKLNCTSAGQPSSVTQVIYPEFGLFLEDGFISHTAGKYFARPCLDDVRMGIHSLRHQGMFVRNGGTFKTVHTGHAHAPSWEIFRRHMKFRMSHGSYRRKPNESMKLQDILQLIDETEGETGVRRFYNDVCLATPDLLARLREHKMLLTARLDLDAKVARWFGELPVPLQEKNA
jgi:glycosyl transferase family 2